MGNIGLDKGNLVDISIYIIFKETGKEDDTLKSDKMRKWYRTKMNLRVLFIGNYKFWTFH